MGSNERNIYKQNQMVERCNRKTTSLFSECGEKKGLGKVEEGYEFAMETSLSPVTGREGIPNNRGN